jgi:hypothetical protein
VCQKLPSQKSSTSSPATVPEKSWWLACSWRGSLFSPATAPGKSLLRLMVPARWEPQEEGVMNIAARFFPQLRNRGLSFMERRDKRLKVMLASLRQLRTIYRAPHPSFALLVATRNLHTHNQVLCSQLTMRLSIPPVCLKQRVWAYRVENSESMRVK